MRQSYLRLSREAAAELRVSLDAAAASAGLSSDYPQEALAEAVVAVAAYDPPLQDLTEVPFLTIDPEGSTDLDQALWLESTPQGWRVLYAIADVPGFVADGGALDAETRRRGETAYLPQGRLPLHPAVISEDAGSLLAEQERGAFVWDIAVAANGEASLTALTRARIRSREQLSYPEAQARLDAGDPLMSALHSFGEARRAQEERRGGANLDLPEHEVEPDGSGGYRIVSRVPLAIEQDNAQVSLMTGMCAAQLMLDAKVGLLRTMPAPDEGSLRRFRAVATGLGHPWPQDMHYGAYLRSLDVSQPQQLAIMHAAGSLFRGAAYTPFEGQVPEDPKQAAVAAPYAHTTAPLRRLVDRFALILAHAHANAETIPDAVRTALPLLPEAMKAASSAVSEAERACLDIVEASLLSSRVGESFEAIVVDGRLPGTEEDGHKPAPSVKVQLLDPPVSARAAGQADSGTRVNVVVEQAQVADGRITLRISTPAG